LANTEAPRKAQPGWEQYRRLLRRDPDSLRFAEFADFARRQGRLVEAATVCARGLMRHPGYATGRVVMGEIFWDQQLEDKAEQEWLEALRLDPGHPRAQLRLGELYLRRGSAARAAEALEASLLFQPAWPEARALLERAQQQLPQSAAQARLAERLAKPSELPPWLAPARFRDLLTAVRACPSVDSALLADADGLLLANGSDTPTDEAEERAAAAVELVQQTRRMVARLGAGKLRAALLRGSAGSLRCVILGNLTLVAGVRPEVPPGSANAEIEEAITDLSQRGERDDS